MEFPLLPDAKMETRIEMPLNLGEDDGKGELAASKEKGGTRGKATDTAFASGTVFWQLETVWRPNRWWRLASLPLHVDQIPSGRGVCSAPADQQRDSRTGA